jgi:RES domain-containing protein
MSRYWRISNHIDLGGWGGKKFSSRWGSLGRRIVYFAESPAGALLEVLVHVNQMEEKLPETFMLMEIAAPENHSLHELTPPTEGNWRNRPEATQQLGDAWLTARETLIARVPSAIVPRTWNYLLNPEHPDAAQVRIETVVQERFDNRLFRFGGP